jgi:selenocysteine lyase/cysteine desulfurase
VREINAMRAEAGRILICVEAVHGFGVEDMDMAGIGYDFFIAGCRQWLFGSRGTGPAWGSVRGWEHMLPTVPSFVHDGTRDA